MPTETEEAAQFAQAKPLVEALFDISVGLVTKTGNFLPHGGVITDDGQVTFISAADDRDMTDAAHVLPLLHDSLRQRLRETAEVAVAVSESVFTGADQTPAIKVLVEHRAGMCRALYMPFQMRLLRKPTFGDVQAVRAPPPEVGGWGG